MGLQIHIDEMPTRERGTEESTSTEKGWKKINKVYGKNLNLATYERGEYQTSPHVHTAEQLNYILEGKVWWFVEDEAFLLTPGDFHRVPANAVHWAKVEEPPNVMIEAHSPPLEVDGPHTVGLYSEDEVAEPGETSENVSVDLSEVYGTELDWREKQRELIAAFYDKNPELR